MSKKVACTRCGFAQLPNALACPQCGARAIVSADPNAQYGMLDLDGGADLGAGPALDTDDASPMRARTRGGSQPGTRRAPSPARSGSHVDPAGAAPRGARGGDANPRASGHGAAPAKGGNARSSQSGERKASSRSGQLPAVDPGRSGAGMRAAGRNSEVNAPRSSALGAPANKAPAGAAARSGTLGGAPGAAKPAAARPGAGTLSGESAARAGATARSGTMRAVQPAQAAASDPALAYGRGMMLDDNPFSDAFGSGRDAPALELEMEAIAPAAQEVAPEPEPEPESPERLRARAIVDLAKYGPRPTSLVQQPLYWFRVSSRKRVLSEELAGLSAQRKRADDQAQEALVGLGEALLALRESPELAALAKQFAAVEDAEHRVDHAAATAQKRRADTTQEIARLKGDLGRAEAKAAPLREREAKLSAQIEELKNAARRAEVASRKAEAELEAGRAKGIDAERWGALVAERDARLGEFQTLGIQLRPLEDDLGVARRELAVHQRAIASIQEEQRAAATALERAQQNQRVTVGSARGARQEALVSLANASLRLGLHAFVPDHSDAVVEAAERAENKRQLEELHRAAVNSYDHVAYQRGFAMLLGSSVLLFLSLAIAILF